jgi:hypothetical protein
MEVLRLFLESANFGDLRNRYERELMEGKRVKFVIYPVERNEEFQKKP